MEEAFYQDFLKLLEKHHVRYMVIGGFAVHAYGFRRQTKDLDIWSDPGELNKQGLLACIEEFGFDTELVRGVDLRGKSPIRLKDEGGIIEILADIVGGFTFDEAFARSELVQVEGVPVRYINLDDLIANKLAATRKQDLVDVDELVKLRELRKKGKKK